MKAITSCALLLLMFAARAEAAATLEGTLYAYDAKTGSIKYIVKHTVEITCTFTSDKWPTHDPVPWRIRVDVDGKQVAMLTAPDLDINKLDYKYLTDSAGYCNSSRAKPRRP